MFAATDWPQTILLIAGLIVAVGVIMHKGVRPTAKAISEVERSLPVVKDLTDAFHGVQEWAPVLKEIAAQFRTDSGSSLRDVVNRIEAAVESLEASRRTDSINQESLRQLQMQDRTQLAAVVAVVDKILAHAGIAEKDAARIAAALKAHGEEEAAGREAIATNLEDTHQRAEQTDSAEAGAAADAAMRRTTDENS